MQRVAVLVVAAMMWGLSVPAQANENLIINITSPCPYPCPVGSSFISRPAGGYLGIEWSGGEPYWSYKIMIVADDDPTKAVKVGTQELSWNVVNPGKRSFATTLPRDMPPGFYHVYIEKIGSTIPAAKVYGPIWDYGPAFWVDGVPK
jgi:hypothetical protein